jgi:outer membrane protein assembly factor BamB
LDTHLAPLKRAGSIITWHDGQIIPGTEWEKDVTTRLQQADIILLLVSPDFIASDHCYSEEMRQALVRHQAGEARVVPILLHPVRWQDAPFSTLQVLPSDARPISLWPNLNEALDNVCNGIYRVISSRERRPQEKKVKAGTSPIDGKSRDLPFIKTWQVPRHRFFLVSLIVLFLLISGVVLSSIVGNMFRPPHTPIISQGPLPPSDNGAMFGYNAQHTRFNPDEKTIKPSNVAQLVQAWTATTGGQIVSSPVVVNGVVYIGSEDRKLYAYKASGCGKNECLHLWVSDPMGGIVDSSPAVVNGKVYIGSKDGKLYVYDASGCGNQKPSCPSVWTSAHVGDPDGDPAQRSIYSSPVIANGIVYVGASDNRLYAYSEAGCDQKSSCPPLWHSDPTGSMIVSSPAVANGRVYVGSYDNRLYAYSATGCDQKSSCPPLWRSDPTGSIFSSPAVADGVVYVGSKDKRLYAYNEDGCGSVEPSCSPIWASEPTGDSIMSSPAVANGVVYIGSGDGRLYAYDIKNCASRQLCPALWVSDPTGAAIASSPTVANGVVYVGSLDGQMYAYDAGGCGGQKSSCPPLWRSGSIATHGIFSSPTVADGKLYIGTQDGTLNVFHLSGVNPS